MYESDYQKKGKLINCDQVNSKEKNLFEEEIELDSDSFLKMGQSRPLFVYFRSFLITISIQIEEAYMVCLGFEPGAAGW